MKKKLSRQFLSFSDSRSPGRRSILENTEKRKVCRILYGIAVRLVYCFLSVKDGNRTRA